jgi:hypothetical protein
MKNAIRHIMTILSAAVLAVAFAACGETAPAVVEEPAPAAGLTAEEENAVKVEEQLAAEEAIDEENADAEAAALEAEISGDKE